MQARDRGEGAREALPLLRDAHQGVVPPGQLAVVLPELRHRMHGKPLLHGGDEPLHEQPVQLLRAQLL